MALCGYAGTKWSDGAPPRRAVVSRAGEGSDCVAVCGVRTPFRTSPRYRGVKSASLLIRRQASANSFAAFSRSDRWTTSTGVCM